MSQLSPTITPTNAVTPPAVIAQAAQNAPSPDGHHGFTFHDFINIINPLQHIPVIGTIYRELTGDTIKPISNMIGGALFGGVLGFAGAAVDSIVEEATGEDIGQHIMATLGLHHGGHSGTAVATAAASASAAGKPVPAFLVAEAAADRAKHSGAGGAAGDGQPTDFWRSLRHGNVAPAKPVITIGPPKVLRDAPAATSSSALPALIGSRPDPLSAFPTVKPKTQDNPQNGTPAPASAPAPSVASATPLAGPTAPLQNGPNGVQPLPRQAIPEMMMQALAKYEAMHTAPQGEAVDQVH